MNKWVQDLDRHFSKEDKQLFSTVREDAHCRQLLHQCEVKLCGNSLRSGYGVWWGEVKGAGGREGVKTGIGMQNEKRVGFFLN